MDGVDKNTEVLMVMGFDVVYVAKGNEQAKKPRLGALSGLMAEIKQAKF